MSFSKDLASWPRSLVSEPSEKRACCAHKHRCSARRTDRSRDCQTGGLPNSAAHVDGAGGCHLGLNDGLLTSALGPLGPRRRGVLIRWIPRLLAPLSRRQHFIAGGRIDAATIACIAVRLTCSFRGAFSGSFKPTSLGPRARSVRR
jgi:hypothetical protein